MDDADLFPDDDLDHLPDNTLLELERNAITSTQKPQQQPRQLLRPKQAHNASSLTRTRSINSNIPWRPPQRVAQVAQASQELPSDNQYDDEDVINLADDATLPGWSQTQRSVVQRESVSAYKKAPIDEETAAAFAAADEEIARSRHHERTTSRTPDLEMQARFAALEAQLEAAQRMGQEARRQLEAKNGEISIVRANADRERKEHEKKVQALQRSYADEAAKHKAEVDAGKKEREKMQTDNRFLQHDLAQETERVRKLNGPKPRLEKDTPRKSRRAGHGDGFDGDEVRTFSPSRSKGQRDSTPRAAKRKRSAQDSPIQSLVFAKPSPLPREDSLDSVQPVPAPSPAVLIPPLKDDNDGVRFMHQLFEYQPFGQARALEAMAAHIIDGKTLSSSLMQALSVQADQSLPLRTISVLCELWTSCLEEQVMSPLRLLVNLILFACRQELPSRINALAEQLVPVCLRTLEQVTMPVVRAHLKASYAAVGEIQQDEFSSLIDADQVTDLLHTICEACTLSLERLDKFWHMMDFTSSMLLLHKALPMHRVMTGLRILHASALPDSFGAIHEDPIGQEQQEKDTVYRLTFALFDVPAVPNDEPPYDELEIAEFRILVLEVLTKLCEFEHGSLLLAKHVHFFGRLVRFLDEQIRKLYTLAPSAQQFTDASRNEHDLVAQTINMAMKILHFLLHQHGDLIDPSEKFAVVSGGYAKFLISMTRLALIEQPTVYEYGIDEDVIDAAHSILDAFLTPEDGEAIAQAFETPQGSKSVRGHAHDDDDVMVID